MTFFAVIWLLIAISTARGLHELPHLDMGQSVALGRLASFDAEAPLRRDHISQRAPQTECDPDDDPYCPVPPLSLSTPTPVTSDDYTSYVAPTCTAQCSYGGTPCGGYCCYGGYLCEIFEPNWMCGPFQTLGPLNEPATCVDATTTPSYTTPSYTTPSYTSLGYTSPSYTSSIYSPPYSTTTPPFFSSTSAYSSITPTSSTSTFTVQSSFLTTPTSSPTFSTEPTSSSNTITPFSSSTTESGTGGGSQPSSFQSRAASLPQPGLIVYLFAMVVVFCL